MIGNALNTLVGLWLAYVAILGLPAGVHTPLTSAVTGLIIIGLAFLARRSDYSGWQSTTNIVLGVLFFLITMGNSVFHISTLVTFWVNLWVGITVASLALWAALYHPKH